MFLRLLAIPVIVMALPGQRTDPPHKLVHQLADHILAAWPQDFSPAAWLRPHVHKTSFVGGISRYDGRTRGNCYSTKGSAATDENMRILVLGGGGGTFGEQDIRSAQRVPNTTWHALGESAGTWTNDPWEAICGADVVVSHAGQSSVADIAAARRPAVVVPQERPFDEQHATARMLETRGMAIVLPQWPAAASWPAVLQCAQAIDTSGWAQWQTEGAAARAAAVIEQTTCRWMKAAGRL